MNVFNCNENVYLCFRFGHWCLLDGEDAVFPLLLCVEEVISQLLFDYSVIRLTEMLF